jgi:sarcosine oxidase
VTRRPRVAVVGAGVVGLATTAALTDAGAEVRLYERHEPGRAQSVGRTRIFRLAHGDARLVALAARARQLWREWETHFRRRLIGDEGLVVTGDEAVATWARAMAAAGAEHRLLSSDEATTHIPIARLPGSATLFDPGAGPTRARRTIECLLGVCAGSLRREEIVEIEQRANACTVSTETDTWECDEVVITAGIASGRLAAAAGIGRELESVHDSRFSFPVREEYRDRPLACWIDKSGVYGPGYTSYGQRVGSSDLYALAVGCDEPRTLAPDEESALHRRKLTEYLPLAYPGLHPVPVDEISCTYAARGVREDGDGFLARRSGEITVIYGNNLFKFAPLLGRLLAQTALSGTLADELAMEPAHGR